MNNNDIKKCYCVIKSLFSRVTGLLKTGMLQWKAYYRQSPWYRKILLVTGIFIICFILFLFLVDINFLWLFGKSPGLSAINNPIQPIASEIYSADGRLIGKYFTENRTPVRYEEISPALVNALISTEDERFYEHFGIDLQGVLAATKDISTGNARGASTITQQLAKNLFKIRSQYSTGLLGYIPGVKLMIMKAKEWIMAVKIETFYSKEEILTMYFNTVDFGNRAYGIKTACKTYFNTTPGEITTEQAATLVGLLKGTTLYNPRINPENSLKRRNVVLENLMKHSFITREQFDSLKRLPLKLNYDIETNYNGEALYFREAVANSLENWCRKNGIDLYSDGLKIYTTIDSRMQKYAEAAVDRQMRVVQRNFDNHWGSQNPWRDRRGKEIEGFIEGIAKRTPVYKRLHEHFGGNRDSIDYYLNLPHRVKVFDYSSGGRYEIMSTMDSIRYMEKFMHCGFVAMEPQTGFVKAWVGDVNFDTWKYDKVTSKRQPGSTFKLFVYTEAFNQGMSPCEERIDSSLYWMTTGNGKPKQWIPRNSNGVFTRDTLSLKSAFAKSVNTIAVQIAKEVGIHNIAQTAYKMGIKTPLEETPALSLGASDVSLLELVNGYGTVIDEGRQHDPVLVSEIKDKDGNIIYQYTPQSTQVLSYETSFLMIEMLKAGLTEPGGTSQALWGYDLFRYNTEFGGKTGTSSNHSDAWFIGVTPYLVAGAWVGGEYRSVHFRTGQLGQGSRTALPVFAYFMEKVLADKSLAKYRAKFPPPKEKINRSYNCRTIHNRTDSDWILLKLFPADSLMIVDENDEIIIE